MHDSATRDKLTKDLKIDRQLDEHLFIKAQEISELIVQRSLIHAINGLRKSGKISEPDLYKIRNSGICDDYTSEVCEFLLRKRCGCRDLVERARKEIIIRVLHDYCPEKFCLKIDGKKNDPAKFFKIRYEKLFKQLKLPKQYAMKKIDPNLYTYYYKQHIQQRELTQLGS